MTTVADVAAEVGRTPAQVLEACRSLDIVATAATSGLSAEEHQRLRDALGAGDLPPVPRGSTSTRPGPVPARTDLGSPPAKRRISARTTTRIGLAVFLVVAVVVAVVSLRGRAEDAGRCVDLGDGPPIEVPCEEPHDAELVGLLELPDGTYPGEDDLLVAAEAPCQAALEQRVGHGDRARLALVLLVPTATSWAQGDRTVSCLVEDPDGRLVGAVAGSGG